MYLNSSHITNLFLSLTQSLVIVTYLPFLPWWTMAESSQIERSLTTSAKVVYWNTWWIGRAMAQINDLGFLEVTYWTLNYSPPSTALILRNLHHATGVTHLDVDGVVVPQER